MVTPQMLVASFIETLVRCRHDLTRYLASLGVEESIQGLLLAVRRREVPREGVANDVTYSIHGIGCRMQLPESGIVDVDLTPEGTEIFDAWRIKRFARSLDRDTELEDDGIDEACRTFVARGILAEVLPMKYSIIGVDRDR